MITKKECERLLEIQSEAQAEIEFLEEIFNEINQITDNPKAFNKTNISEYLQNLLSAKENKFIAFTKEYGIAIKSIGGVQIGEIKEIEYTDDETRGDLYPRVIEWVE